MKRIFCFLGLAALVAGITEPAAGCSRVLYQGPEGMTATGRTMDWREDPKSNLYIFPRGEQRRGGRAANSVQWTSKYGSVSVAGYDVGISDGMNERGLVVNLLFLNEAEYTYAGDTRPVMGMSVWAQYVLDNFATVDEAVTAMRADAFRIVAPDIPDGGKSTLHMAISDPSGDSAILEYIDGRLQIHHGREYRVLTNSPIFPDQLAIDAYWQQVGGTRMLPGTNRPSDRFVRGTFYVGAVEQSAEAAVAVPTLLSVMRNLSVPYGISTPDNPHSASTRWRVIYDQKNRVMYFEPTLALAVFHVDFADVDFAAGTGERELRLTDGTSYAGDATGKFVRTAKPFGFMFTM